MGERLYDGGSSLLIGRSGIASSWLFEGGFDGGVACLLRGSSSTFDCSPELSSRRTLLAREDLIGS